MDKSLCEKNVYIFIYIKWTDRSMPIYVFNFPSQSDYIFKMTVF